MGLLKADWWQPGQGVFVPASDANLAAIVANPTLRSESIVRSTPCSGCSGGVVTGVLILNWNSRSLEIDQINNAGPGTPPYFRARVPIPGDAVVLVLDVSEGSPVRFPPGTFFGLAPADGFVKVADIPK